MSPAWHSAFPVDVQGLVALLQLNRLVIMLADRNSARRSGLRVIVRASIAMCLAVAGLGVMPDAAVSANSVAAGPVPLVVVVPLVLPAGTTGLVPAATLSEYTAPTGILTRELDAVTSRNVAIGIDPAILASIRILGDAAPPSALAWLARLSAVANDTFALGYSDSDLTLPLQAGSGTVLAPTSFGFAIDATRFATPGTVAAPGDTTPPKPPLPTTASLLAWRYTIDGLGWPRENTVVAADLDALSVSGLTTTLLSSANVDPDRSVGGRVVISGYQGIVSDDAVSVALRAALDATSDAAWQLAMSRLTSAIADAGPKYSTVLATTGRSSGWVDGRFTQTIDALAASASLGGTRLSAALSATPGAAELVPKPHTAADLEAAAQLLAAESAEREFATVAADPSRITGARRVALLAVLSNQARANEALWPSVAAAFLTKSAELLASVAVVSTSGVNLFADRASLPITVSNGLDQAVTVFITVRPDTGLLTVADSRVRLDIEPNSQGKGLVPVQAISNGTVRVTVRLESITGVAIGTPTRTPINVQAGWETPVVVVIAALVVALFAAGIVRSIVRRRKSARD
jgi:hypothetical protein